VKGLRRISAQAACECICFINTIPRLHFCQRILSAGARRPPSGLRMAVKNIFSTGKIQTGFHAGIIR
jgi:hypothetical protein